MHCIFNCLRDIWVFRWPRMEHFLMLWWCRQKKHRENLFFFENISSPWKYQHCDFIHLAPTVVHVHLILHQETAYIATETDAAYKSEYKVFVVSTLWCHATCQICFIYFLFDRFASYLTQTQSRRWLYIAHHSQVKKSNIQVTRSLQYFSYVRCLVAFGLQAMPQLSDPYIYSFYREQDPVVKTDVPHYNSARP